VHQTDRRPDPRVAVRASGEVTAVPRGHLRRQRVVILACLLKAAARPWARQTELPSSPRRPP
jgi:hypothetical protein